MKIKKIEVKNLNGRTFNVCITNPLTVFLAPNGVGKSTLVTALNIIFGDKPKNVLPEYAVQVTVNDGVKLGVKKTPSTYSYYVNGKKVTLEAYTKVLLDEACEGGDVDSAEALRVTTTSELFNAAQSESIMDYLLPHIGSALDADRVLAFSPSASDLAETELRAVLPPMPESFDLAELDKAQKLLSIKRREVNAELKAIKTMADRLRPNPVKRTLQEVEDEEKAFILAHKDATLMIQKQREYEAAVKKAEEQKKVIAAYEEQLKEIDKLLDGRTATDEMKQKIQEKKELAQKSKTEHSNLLATLSKDVSLIETTLENLDKPVCPISGKLICTTDKTGVKKELQESLLQNEACIKKVRTALEKDAGTLEKCTSNERIWDEVNKLENKRKTIAASKEAFEKNPIEIPQKPADVIDASEYDETLRKLKIEAQDIKDTEQKKELEGKIGKLTESAETLDILVKALDSKGVIKAQCVDLCIQDINTLLEDRAGHVMEGFSICLRPENGITIYAKTPNNREWTQHAFLSSGEKIVVAVLMMDLINQMAPTGVMVIDNIEQLDRETIEKLKAMLTSPEVALWYHNVFVMGVDHKEIVDAFSDLNAINIKDSDIKIESAA
ncbi:MAG: hypothetical protein J6I76_09575 [Oribacterium sp.]|nr:hypothetical protein [Oribacterium sp.]